MGAVHGRDPRIPAAATGKRAADTDRDGRAALSRDELSERAQKEAVPGRSSMSKDELVDALES